MTSYIENHQQWDPALVNMRELLLELGYEEAYKWSRPVYMLQGKNRIGIGAFKNHFAIWFMHGNLLSDPLKVLSNAQPGKTKEMRHWKWTNVEDVDLDALRVYFIEDKEKAN